MSATPHAVPLVDSHDVALQRALAAYVARWPDEQACVEDFLALLSLPVDVYVRERLEGHLTASAWLVDQAGARVLLTHHRKLGRWLQLGGHADGDRALPEVALREAREESGLADLRLQSPAIFDLDRHWIPERRDVPAHWHYDVRYVVRAGGDETYAVSEESLDLAWRDIAALVDDTTADASLRRMASKWRGRTDAGRSPAA